MLSWRVTTAGLRELRQNASDLVRQAEAGETITVTVSGREVAELGPVRRDRWRTWTDVAAVFDGPADLAGPVDLAGPADLAWAVDRDAVDQAPRNPFDA